MATRLDQKPYEVQNLSGGVQRKTTKFTKDDSQVELAINADFSRIGGIQKILGYEQLGNTITSSTTSSSSTTTTSSSSTSTSTSSSTSTSTSTSSTTTP